MPSCWVSNPRRRMVSWFIEMLMMRPQPALTITGAKVKASITMLGGQTLSLPLPPITLHDIGGGEENKQGVAFATAINDILNAILAGVSQVITGVGGVAADGVKAAGDGLNKLGDGLGKALGGAAGLFKKNAEPPPQK